MASKIIPLEDRVVVEPIEESQRSAGGVFIPDTAKERPKKGRVLWTGEGLRSNDGSSVIPLTVQVGDTVVFGKYAGTEMLINDKTVYVMRQSEILGIIEE